MMIRKEQIMIMSLESNVTPPVIEVGQMLMKMRDLGAACERRLSGCDEGARWTRKPKFAIS
jgi:hypothetical protein